MFGKLKDLHEMKKQASAMQAMLAQEKIEAENHGVKIVINGNQEVLQVEINPALSREEQEKYLQETFNQAIKKAQHLMAQKMMTSGFGF